MFRSIRAGDFVFHDEDWSHISTSAKKLVLGLLQVDPKTRLTPREALDSEWMLTKDDVLRRKSLEKGLAKIVSFKARRKLKGAIAAVMYAVGGKFWNIDTAAIWREDMRTEGAVIADTPGVAVDDDSSPPPAFDRLYRLDRKLQVGQCATVWEGTEIETGKTHAIKVVQREGLTQLEDAAVMNEVSILRSLRHENIVPLLDFFETPTAFCLVMEKCNGGDVLDKVASIEHYTEKDACQFSKGLLEVRGEIFMCQDSPSLSTHASHHR
jgi:serine/threonine protein kinase